MDLKYKLILVIAGLGWLHQAEGCNSDMIQQCQSTFLRALGISPSGASGGTIPHLTGARLRSACRAFDTFTECLRPHTIGCSESMRLIYGTEEDVYGYICNEGFQDQLRYGDCISNDQIRAESNDCAEEMKREMTDQFCTGLNNGVECEVRVVQRNCGNAAATYTMELLRHSFKTLTENFGCEIEWKFYEWKHESYYGWKNEWKPLTTTVKTPTRLIPGISDNGNIWPDDAFNDNYDDVVYDDDDDDDDNSDRIPLSTGAVIIIAISGVILTSAIVFLFVYLVVKRNKKSTTSMEKQVPPVHGNHYAGPPPAYSSDVYEKASSNPASELPVCENLQQALLKDQYKI